MTDDLAAWLRAQLDEDERVALATDALYPWVANDDAEVFEVVGNLNDPRRCPEHVTGEPNMCSDLLVASGEDISDQLDTERAAHIARHDPARVLREVEAKRAIVDEVFRWMAMHDGEWGCCHSPTEIAEGRCEDETPNEDPILRLLASVYADRPGYRAEWAPDPTEPGGPSRERP